MNANELDRNSGGPRAAIVGPRRQSSIAGLLGDRPSNANTLVLLEVDSTSGVACVYGRIRHRFDRQVDPYKRTEHLVRSREAGFNHYLVMPADLRELDPLIASWRNSLESGGSE